MKTAEQEWKDRAINIALSSSHLSSSYELGISDFKAALKEEIKKRIQKLEMGSGRKRELESVLDLIDQVKPKQS